MCSMGQSQKGIIPFEEYNQGLQTKIQLKFVTENKRADLCCYTYHIIVKEGSWVSENDLIWGIYFPGDVVVADPKTTDMSVICDKDKSEYEKGKEGDPQVIFEKFKGERDFEVSFISTSETSEKTLLVLCVKKNNGWQRVNYENQYYIHGPRAR